MNGFSEMRTLILSSMRGADALDDLKFCWTCHTLEKMHHIILCAYQNMYNLKTRLEISDSGCVKEYIFSGLGDTVQK